MRTIFFHNLIIRDTIKTVIAIADTEPVDVYLEIKKIYYTTSIPAGYEYPWNVGIKMINWKENIRGIGTFVFEKNNIDKNMSHNAITTIFEGVKN